MLDTVTFVSKLQHEGYTHCCVVPCSFARHLINALINFGDSLEYIPCASEAVACSVAAGLRMSGKRPIVIAQSSGLANMVSCITSLLKPYDIFLPIIVSWRTYVEGDSEVQHAHLANKLPDLIDACGYQYELLDQDSEDNVISQLICCEERHQMLVLKKDTFSSVTLDNRHSIDLSQYPKRSEYLRLLNKHYRDKNVVFIGTTGNTSREMNAFMPDSNNFYMSGNMGGALSIGLGAAKAGKRVVVCGGDAEFVMHMGGIATSGRYANEIIDLTYLLFDNESNKSTGGQRSYQRHVNYTEIVASCGAVVSSTIDSIDDFLPELLELNKLKGFKFMHIKTSYDTDIPRPSAEIIRTSQEAFLGH